MPIIWRYMIAAFLRTFLLCVSTFIAVLLTSRFKEIARFAALSCDLSKTALFVAYQTPLIFPVAIPLSALIASLILFQRLSRTFELTALRASGYSLNSLLTPILLTASFLSFCNFSFCAEIAPFCRRASRDLLYTETSSNPLILLQRQHLIKAKQSYIHMEASADGKSAKNLFLITHNPSNKRLTLISARKLFIENSNLLGQNIALISHLHSDKEQLFDPLILENETSISTDAAAITSFLKKGRPRLEPAALSLPMLRMRYKDKGRAAKKAFVECLRRVSLSCAVFTFTFLGCVFGIEQGRNPSKKNLIIALVLTLIVMMSYSLGKEFKASPFIAILIFLFPHPLIWGINTLKLRRIAKGI